MFHNSGNGILISEKHKKDKDYLLKKKIGIENIKATIFVTILTFLTRKLTNYQSNDIFVTSNRIYFWLRYKMKATEPMQIILQILRYVLYAGVTFEYDSTFMTLVASALKYFIDVILLQIHCSQGLTLGLKTVSSCKFRSALISAVISINFILFDMVSFCLI